ncbi:hypothetical protein BDF19DRAFT_455828 [Syncephalis fuscata]|nr:hypothetical protein BDF19DRAFT_455828 [Syncephalis fuscata]
MSSVDDKEITTADADPSSVATVPLGDDAETTSSPIETVDSIVADTVINILIQDEKEKVTVNESVKEETKETEEVEKVEAKELQDKKQDMTSSNPQLLLDGHLHASPHSINVTLPASTATSVHSKEEEKEEPHLKYQRVTATNVVEIFKKDAASIILVSDKFMIIGTHWGMVHIMDFTGNEVKKYRAHAATVQSLSIDQAGEYVASASDDGHVIVQSLYAEQPPIILNYMRPLKCVAIEPNYARSTARRIVSGGLAEQLVLYEKGWFSGKNTTLHSNAGPIGAITWRTHLIAWADDMGVKMHDVTTGRRITFIDRPLDSPRADLYQCHLRWKNDSLLYIGWANCIKMAMVKSRSTRSPTQSDQSLLYVEIISVISTDYIVSGIVPYGDMILVLAYTFDQLDTDEETLDLERQKRKTGSLPELRILDADNEEISADALAITGYEFYQPNDYSLACATTGDLFYVLGPKDLIVAEARTADDHIAWLLARERYADALTCAQSTEEQEGMTGLTIGQAYLETLFEQEAYTTAAKWCPTIMRNNTLLWEQWVFAFASVGQLKIIIPYLPTKDTQLSNTVYEMALVHFLNVDHEQLWMTLQQWPSQLYDIHSVVVAIEDVIQSTPDDVALMECLALLYVTEHRPEKALEYYLRLHRPDTIELIRNHNLFAEVQDKVLLLMQFSQQQQTTSTSDDSALLESATFNASVKLLVTNTDAIPVGRVVEQLAKDRKLLFIYLDALFEYDPSIGYEYHNLQIELYAEYAPHKLLAFMRTCNTYSLEEAYNICYERDFIPEMVYLLGRMGNSHKALWLIIERLDDVHQAVEFAKEQNDAQLWDNLLTYSKDKPVFIKSLLEGVGSHVDPVRLVELIPKQLEIPGLKQGISKILQDYALQLSLQNDCNKILTAHISDLGYQQLSAQRRGYSCSPENMICHLCEGPLLFDTSVVNVLFFCGHAFHEFCLFDGDLFLADQQLSMPDGSVSRKADAMLGIQLNKQMRCPQCMATTIDKTKGFQQQAAVATPHQSPMINHITSLHKLPPVEQLTL